MPGMSIAEVADRSGYPPSTLRYYEQLGILEAVPRRSGRRSYPPEVLERLAAIRVAQRAGFTLAEIRALVDPSQPHLTERWRSLARRKLDEAARLMARATEMRRAATAVLVCECSGPGDCALLRG